ncbi:MAG: TetR/AcrR family transcriptional regulator [Burkholderiaceae bacterium]|nr:TetR/AcrR family transcriptional regulator [Burkholderiaceae bacterium]
MSFDREAVLERAMCLFWQQGYETTSVGDLTSAMGITAPSLYAAFGDKEGLYREALERYKTRRGDYTECLMSNPTDTREVIRTLLVNAANTMCCPDTPSGCMIVLSGVNCSPQSADIQQMLANCRADFEADLTARIQHGIEHGDVPAQASAPGLAKFYSTVLSGMSMQARHAATHEMLIAICEAAMQAWPATVAR